MKSKVERIVLYLIIIWLLIKQQGQPGLFVTYNYWRDENESQ